ncbi:hypothetical protein DID77_04130 [Candidatus Marinamargulisbacteria bacterium SCGC AG-439-L15]|nr:hypothetical protein DID77_04130 [Candidatus Marinamargulisbacteria bacterium SCGC AG-439-L15]
MLTLVLIDSFIMRYWIWIFGFFIVFLMSSQSVCEQRYVIKKWELKTAWGTGLPSWGYFKHSDFFDINGVKGFNLLIGYGEKNFTEPIHPDEINYYTQWGTVAFLVPYFGVGLEYIWGGGFYMGVGTFYIIPYPYIGVYLSEFNLSEY